jgi:hypothetical protein
LSTIIALIAITGTKEITEQKTANTPNEVVTSAEISTSE